MNYELNKNFANMPILYRVLYDKKHNKEIKNKLLENQNIKEIFEDGSIITKKIKYNSDQIKEISFNSSFNKELSYNENLLLQKYDYLSMIKTNLKFSVILFIVNIGLLKFTKKSMEMRQPFVFLDNNRIFHNRLHMLKNSLYYSLKFFNITSVPLASAAC